MTLVPGESSYIEYLWRDGHTRRASLRNTDVHSVGLPFQNTDDPNWYVEDLTNGVDRAEVEWLTYMNPDLQGNRSDWSVRIHCEYQPPSILAKLTASFNPFGGITVSPGAAPANISQYIFPWFQHVRTNGTGNHPDVMMVFVAPEGTAWRADIQKLYRWPAPPTFILTPLPGIPVRP